MKQDIEVRYAYKPPKPIWLTVGDVTFTIDGALATFYRWAQYMDLVEEFMKDFQPYYWPNYQKALRIKEAQEARKREQHESALEQLRIKQNAKKYERRMANKNSVISPENAVLPL